MGDYLRSSVTLWLTDLRTTVENYDVFECFLKDGESELNKINTSVHNNLNGEVEEINELKEEMVVDNRNSGEYVNIWDCCSGTDNLLNNNNNNNIDDIKQKVNEEDLGTDSSSNLSESIDENSCNNTDSQTEDSLLQVSFGNISRISINFNESVDELKVLPVLFEQLDLEPSEDVKMWKHRLRFSYSDEDMNLMEATELYKPIQHPSKATSEELIQNLCNGNEDKHSLEKLGPFPIDNSEVEIRKSSLHKERQAKSKTEDYTTHNFKSNGSKLELKGTIKIECAERCLEVKKKEFLYLDTSNYLRIRSNDRKAISNTNILWKNSIRSIKLLKREATVKTENGLFLFIFDSLKDAKTFENELCPNIVEKTAKKSILSLLLRKRSSRDHLENKGIYKNEPLFGNTLEEICKNKDEKIPNFIVKTIELIELTHNITSLGVYRTSGNLATIQSIRFSLNEGNIKILDEYSNDVDVLTGALKLFFRELKEPLIPYGIIPKLTEVMRNKVGTEKEKEFRSIIKLLPLLNKNILLYITRHLLEVAKYKDVNKMDISNLSICWSPSLIVIPDNIPDLVIQTANASKVVEFILTYYNEHPSELPEYKDYNVKIEVGTLKRQLNRQESKDSLDSNESGSKSLNKSNLSLNSEYQRSAGFAISQLIKLIKIDAGLSMEGIYRKSGSVKTRDKILKKIEKQKYDDLYEKGKRKYEIYDYCDALKKYIKDMKSPLIPKAIFEDFSNDVEDCDKYEKIMMSIDYLPTIGILKDLLCHLSEIIGTKGMDLASVTDIWSKVLNPNNIRNTSDAKLIEILLNRYGVKSKVNQELKEKLDRSTRDKIVSRYDNID